MRLAVPGPPQRAPTRSPPPRPRTRSASTSTRCGAGLAAFQPPGMRMEVTQLPTGVTVLNDAYNANPASMAAALRTLAASRGAGAASPCSARCASSAPTAARRAPRRSARAAAAAGLDALFLLGAARRARCATGAEAAGLPAERIVVAASHDDARGARCTRSLPRRATSLLLKGSRGAAMEQVLRALRARRRRRAARDALPRSSTRCTPRYAPLNVFRYITFRTLLAGLTALTLSLLLGPLLIRRLSALQIGQSIRADGPAGARRQGGHADHGRHADPLLARSSRPCCSPTCSDWYVWIALARDPRPRAHRLRRRLGEGPPAATRRASRAASGSAAEFAIAGAGGAGALHLVRSTAGTLTMPFLKDVRPDLGLWYMPVRRRSSSSARRTRST